MENVFFLFKKKVEPSQSLEIKKHAETKELFSFSAITLGRKYYV